MDVTPLLTWGVAVEAQQEALRVQSASYSVGIAPEGLDRAWGLSGDNAGARLFEGGIRFVGPENRRAYRPDPVGLDHRPTHGRRAQDQMTARANFS